MRNILLQLSGLLLSGALARLSSGAFVCVLSCVFACGRVLRWSVAGAEGAFRGETSGSLLDPCARAGSAFGGPAGYV